MAIPSFRPTTRLIKAVGVITLVGLVGLAVSPATLAATTWHDVVGAETHDEGIQANAFLPNDLTIDVGDSITWTFPTGEIHTVTFLSGGARPPLAIPSGGGVAINPVVAAPAGGSSYGGTGYFNSGIVTKESPNPSYTLSFTATGNFPFVCLIHSTMTGTVHVQPAGAPYPATQADYDRQARQTAARLLAEGHQLEAKDRPTGQNHQTEVTVGTGALQADSGIAVVRFLPDRSIIRAGETVHWTNRDPETPHTVTFGTEPPGGPFGAFSPSGTDGPGHATLTSTSQSVNSGFLGAGVPSGNQFSATFTQPGTYTYFCSIHDELGMEGTIQVLAAQGSNQ